MERLAIDFEDRFARTRDWVHCPTCTQPDYFVDGLVRVDGIAWIAYAARSHDRDGDVEVLIDIALGLRELGEMGEMDGPDGYCVVFACRITDGRAELVDAPVVADEDSGWRTNLRREEALTHEQNAEWREVLAFIASADPVVRRAGLQAP